MLKNSLRSTSVVAALCASLLLSACGEADGQQEGAGGQALPVSAKTLAMETVVHSEQLPGRTTAFKVAEIRPQVSGVIMERSFVEGGEVKEGQQLYQIDPAIYRANYESALADLQRARANVKSVQAKEERYAELVEIDAVSRQEYDDIEAELATARADIAVAQANVKTAKVNLDYTKVYSPISGRIGKSAVTEGALVTANQAELLARVTQLDPIYVDMNQSSTDLMRIRNELGEEQDVPVTLVLDNGDEYAHEGTLQFSEVTVDATTGTVQLRALFPNPDRVLLPGLFVQAFVQLGKQEHILVPQKAAIRDKDGNLSVWVIGADSTVNPRVIQVSKEYKDQWIVTSGVNAGEQIVTEGFQKIQPGMKVQPTPASPNAEQAAIQQAGEQMEEAQEEGEAPTAAVTPAPAMPEGDAQSEDAQAEQE